MKAVVVGGGLIGMLTARELANSGVSVTLLEQGEIGRESSWAGGGILSPLYPWNYADAVNDLAAWSQQHYPRLVSELIEEGGIDPQWTRNGLLVLDTEMFPGAILWAQARAIAYESLDSRRMHTGEPELSDAYQQGLLFPDIAQIRNPRLIKSLHTSCLEHGIQLIDHSPVKELLMSEASVTGVVVDNRCYEADVVVICAGAWSAQLVAGLDCTVPIKPMRGQMILYHTVPGRIQRITLSKGRYVIPRRDGRVLAGSTLEDVGFDKSTTEQALAELREAAESLYPCLHDAPIERHWSGLRPESPQGIPYICSIPGTQGLFLNAGHFRNGVVLGPASARLMADIVMEREPILDITPYSASRGVAG